MTNKTKYTREMFIPKDAQLTVDIQALGVQVWQYRTRQGQPAAVAFQGKANKPAWHYHFRNEDYLARYVNDWLRQKEENAEIHNRYNAERSNELDNLKVGDILNTCWGYDQTNIEFYQVTARTAGTFTIREIAAMCATDAMIHADSGTTYPIRDKFIGPPEVRRSFSGGKHSYKSLHVWDGSAKHFSWGH